MIPNLKYHHLGISTNEKHEGETYLEKFKVYVSGYETSEYKIEWMRYEEDSPVNELVKSIPHIAFQVENLEDAVRDKKIVIEPNSPSGGVHVAFIVENGAPIEFIQIDELICE